MRVSKVVYVANLVVFFLTSSAFAEESLKHQIQGGILKPGLIKNLEKEEALDPETTLTLNKFFRTKQAVDAGYRSQDEFIKDREKVIGLLMRYSTQVTRISTAFRSSFMADVAREFLLEYDVDPDAKTGVWNFKEKIVGLRLADAADLQTLERFNVRLKDKTPSLADFLMADKIRNRIEIRREMAKEYLNLEIMTRWCPDIKPFDNAERYNSLRDALKKMAELSRDLLKENPQDNIDDTVKHAKVFYQKTKEAMDSLTAEIGEATRSEHSGYSMEERSILDPSTVKTITIRGDQAFFERFYAAEEEKKSFDIVDAQVKVVSSDVTKQFEKALSEGKLPAYAMDACAGEAMNSENTMKDALSEGHLKMKDGDYEEAVAYYSIAENCYNSLPWYKQKIWQMARTNIPADYIKKARLSQETIAKSPMDHQSFILQPSQQNEEANKGFPAVNKNKPVSDLPAVYQVRLIPEYVEGSARPWTTHDYQITVFNEGNQRDAIRLSIEGSLAAGWNGQLSQQVIDLGPGESEMVTFTVTFGDASPGDSNVLRVIARSSHDSSCVDSMETKNIIR